jgi:sugar/nucleoside kinase (ribokinase family)
MSTLVVGSVALDTLQTPFGEAEDTIGGSAVYFSAAASLFGSVQVVGVVGDDYPHDKLAFLNDRGVDLSGIETRPGESFRWAGRYTHDLSSPETLETRLGVFADFHPRIPDAFASPDLLFLGNIDPRLQLEVLDRVGSVRLVACDTMNYWIDGQREPLMELLGRVDVLFANDGEIRQLAGEANLVAASRWVQSNGPRCLVVKKGEHGAIFFDGDEIFFVPGYPLEALRDPTGAGDSFAGGFFGFLHGMEELSTPTLKRASVFGTALGSFAIEDFGVARLARLTREEVAGRVRELRAMTQFEDDEEAAHADG